MKSIGPILVKFLSDIFSNIISSKVVDFLRGFKGLCNRKLFAGMLALFMIAGFITIYVIFFNPKQYVKKADSLISEQEYAKAYEIICKGIERCRENDALEEMRTNILYSYETYVIEMVKELLQKSSGEARQDIYTKLNDMLADCSTQKMRKSYIEALSNCGVQCLEYSIYDASVITEQALKFAREFDGLEDNNILVGSCCNNRASVLIKESRYLEAEDLYLEAVRLFEESGILCDMRLAELYTNLAYYYLKSADYGRALSYEEKVFNILKQLNKTESLEMGVAHLTMAEIYEYIHENQRINELESARRILENNKPASNSYLISLYDQLGLYYSNMDPTRADKYFEDAHRLSLEGQGEFGIGTIEAEIHMARSYVSHGKVIKALELLENAVVKSEHEYGTRGSNSAYVYAELANIYWKLEEYVKANKYYDLAISIYEDEYGTSYPSLATLYGNKGKMLMESGLGREQEAFRDIENAVRILENNYMATQKEMASLLTIKGEMYQNQEHWEESIRVLEDARQIYKKLYGDICDYLIDVNMLMGQGYIRLKNDNSYQLLFSSLEYCKELHGDYAYKTIIAYILMGDCLYKGLGEGSKSLQMENAISYYNRAEEILESFDNINTKDNAYLYEQLGTAWYCAGSDRTFAERKSNFEKSIKCYKKAQDIYTILQQENSAKNVWLWARMARVYAYLGDMENAERYLVHAMNYVDRISSEKMKFQIYSDLLGTYEVLEDNDKCKEYANYLKSMLNLPEITSEIDEIYREWIYKYAD